MKKRITCLVLTLCLLLSAMPIMSFAAGETPAKDYYQKITSTSQMVAGARYLIASAWENCVLDGSLGEEMDSANNHIEVDIENGRIEATDELDAAAFEIDVSTGTIKSVSGYYIGSAASQNSIEISETSDFVNEISFDNGELVVGHQGTKDYFALQFNDQSGQKRFRFYKNAGQTPIELYMRVDVPVPYVDADGTAQTPVSDYTTLSSGVTEWTNGWYVLKSDVTFGERIAVKGDNVNLILCDGKTLTVNGGVFIREGYALTVWAQQAGTGKLIAIGSDRSGFESAGIGSSWESGTYMIDENTVAKHYAGDLTVNGGVIEATGGHYCAGIGGSNERKNGTVTINGGSVTAVGGKEASGIGGGRNSGRGTVIVNGGVVNATGGSYGTGIGGGRNAGRVEITIAGGTVTAHGSDDAAAIGSGCDGAYDKIRFTGGVVNADDGIIGGNGCTIRFSYTEPGYGMRVTAGSYIGNVTFEKPFASLENPKRTFSGRVSIPIRNQTVYPKTAGLWNVSFDQNGGTGSMNSLSVIGGPYTLPDCGFTSPSAQQPFAGWLVKVGNTDSVVKQPGEQVLVSADTTVKAVWLSTHTVSFDNGGGSGSMASASVSSCESYTLPANGFTAPTGKHFYGWQVTNGIDAPKTMQPGDTLTVTEDTSVQALWTVTITSWAQLQSAISNAQSGDTIALGQSLTAASGDSVLTVSGNKSIALDLNGFTLDRARSSTDADGHVIIVYSPAALTIKDSSGDNSGCITGGWATNGGGINNQGTLHIEGGTITGNKAANGGAICNRAAMTITGGVITANTATGDGGAIWNEGTASLSSLTITNHSGAQNGGAIANFNAGTITANDCVISGNTASDLGGAFYVASGSISVTESELSDNTSGDGGAIYNTAGNTVTLTDVSLHDNKTTQHGGGAITNYGTANLTDCELWQNEAATRGGAIWCGINSGASLSLSACAVSANTAALDGGGICMNTGTLTMSGTTVNGNSANDGGGLFVNENVTAQLGGNGNLFFDNVSSSRGGGITNLGDLRISALFTAQENSTDGKGGGVYNGGLLSAQDLVIITDNHTGVQGKDLYLTSGKVIKLTGALVYSTIGIDAENTDQFLTSQWYDMQRNADPESVFTAREYYTVYMPDGSTELKIKKSDDNPYTQSATMGITNTDSATYRTKIDYVIHNLTAGSVVNYPSGWESQQYSAEGGVYKKTYQNAANNNITGVSVGTLEIDRSRLDRVEQTGIYVEYAPHIFSTVGKARWGVELFPYSESIPNIDLSNNVGQNAYNTVTLTGTENGSYTYQLHYGAVDGALRCAETSSGNFAADAACASGQDITYGPYSWYVTGDAPAVGESVTLRVAAICCARPYDENLQVLTAWTDVTVTGTCSHSNGHLHAIAASAPTCTDEGNSAYWKCDVCGKYFSDAQAENEIEQDSWIVEPNGHSYAEPAAGDWTWTKSGNTYTAVVTVACEHCDDAQTLTAAVEKTAAADGTAVYTATAAVGEGSGAQTFTATKPTVYHSVTGFNDGSGNTVTADKATAAEGQTVTLTAAPASGCGLKTLTVTSGADGVTVTAGANGTFTFTMPDGDAVVNAVFEQNYTVAVVTDGHGLVTATPAVPFAGDTVTLTVTPNEHYELDTLTVTDADGAAVTVTNNSFVMPSKNVTVTASFYAVYPLWVGGVQVNGSNASNVLGDGSVVYEGDLTGGTLTLTDANITGLHNASNIYTFITEGYDNFDLTIVLSGDNTLSGGYYGVYFYSNSRLTITGSGSLTASGSTDGIYTGHGCQLLIDSTTVTASAASNFGIECNSSPLTITDSTVTSTGSYMGIDASDLTIANSDVTATAEGISYALYCTGIMRITDSTVNATAAHAYGICSNGNGSAAIIITNSSVSASSGNSDGIEAGYSGIIITDSTVETIGYYQGISCDGTLTVNGNSTVTVNNRNVGYAALLTGDLSLGKGLGISEPENAVFKTYSSGKKAVYQSNGQTLADRVVISRTAPTDYQSVTIDDQIALNLMLDLDFRGKTVNDVSITLNNVSYTAEGTLLTKGDYAGLYKFTVVMAPAQIADEIAVTIGSETLPTTSVMAYCVTLSGHDYDEYPQEQNLAKAILQYGKAAKAVFNYSGDEITTVDELNTTSVAAYTGAKFNDGTGKVIGASFMALTKPEFRFYTSGITEAQGYAYNQAGVTAAYVNSNIKEDLSARFVKKEVNGETLILIEVTGVSAENMDELIVVTVPELGNIYFNGNVFAKAMAVDEDEGTQNLGAALYNYGEAANACFKG